MPLDHPIPEMRCLVCDTQLNQASDNKESTAPKPDDWTICLYCNALMVFKDDLTLRMPTEAEQEEAKQDPVVTEMLEFAEYFAHVYGKAPRH